MVLMLDRTIESINSFWSNDRVQQLYHIPVLAFLMIFMFLVRIQAYPNFIREDGKVAFAAVDSWYHWRTTMYTVQNWPFTMPYDVWTGYPSGRYVGQFGTLFDQIIATAALIVGIGDPSIETVFYVALVIPPAMAAFCVIPTYYIGNRLGGRPGGLFAVVLLALFPGTFLHRSTVGMLQHHVAEVLFMTIAILAMMAAVTVADREKLSYEELVQDPWQNARTSLIYSIFAGFALTVYIWIWPPGIVLGGIFGLFFAITITYEHARERNPEHLATVGAISLGITGLLTLITREVTTFSVTSAGLLQPLLALFVAFGCLFMAYLAKKWEKSNLSVRLYPVAVSGLIGIAVVVLAVALPDAFETIVQNVQRRVFFGQQESDLTIQEARPPADLSAHLAREFGVAFYTALIGLVLLLVRPILDARFQSEHLLIVVWSVVIISMSFTQSRFSYYLAVVVALLNAYLLGQLIRWIGSKTRKRVGTERNTWDPLMRPTAVVGILVIILLLPLLTSVGGATAIDAGANAAPSGDSVKWAESNQWLTEHTPEQGTYGGEDNSLDYYGTYEHPENGGYNYPDGTYGIMSWWDYGHLITVQGERIPHANPFQQNAESASEFFTASSEEESEEELADGIEYVMIDDSMAGGKFYSITGWSGPDYEDYLSPQEYEINGETETIDEFGEEYDETTLSRLYHDDATEMDHYRLVHESEQETTFVSVARQTDENTWEPVYVNSVLTLEIFELVESRPDLIYYDQREGASVKTYERVEGAELSGTVDAEEGETVTAVVPMEATTSDRTFEYTQQATVDENGEFTMTVPYATDNELGADEGYTDTSVMAEDDYTVYTGDNDNPTAQSTASVPESTVYEGETIEVDLVSS